DNRLVRPRLKFVHVPNQQVAKPDVGIARADADCLFSKRDHLIQRPGEKLAPAKALEGPGHVAIESQRRLELGHRIVASPLGAQDRAFDVVLPRDLGPRCRDSSISFSARASSAILESANPLITRFTNAPARKVFASVNCGSTRSACSYKSMAFL